MPFFVISHALPHYASNRELAKADFLINGCTVKIFHTLTLLLLLTIYTTWQEMEIKKPNKKGGLLNPSHLPLFAPF
jgi:hypothetical protein